MTITYSQFQGPLQLHKAKNWLPTSALDLAILNITLHIAFLQDMVG